MSGLVKDFFDHSDCGVLDKVDGRPGATMVCAGRDGRSASRRIERIATGWRLRPVAEPLVACAQARTPDQILRLKQVDPMLRRGALSSRPPWPPD